MFQNGHRSYTKFSIKKLIFLKPVSSIPHHFVCLAMLLIILNLYHVYSNKYGNNYSFVILICLQTSRRQHLSIILLTTICCSAHNLFISTIIFVRSSPQRSLNTQLHTRLTEFLLFSTPLSCPFVYARLQSAERSQSRRFRFSPSRGFYLLQELSLDY